MPATLKAHAQQLRRAATDEERRLWYCFLCRYPVRFRRQFVLRRYIVDFYCAEAALAVELDGSQHYEEKNMAYDARRTEALNELGIKVLRFTNVDVNRHFETVCEQIHNAVESRKGMGKRRKENASSASHEAPSPEGKARS